MTLESLIRSAKGRLVYGIDRKGHGGRVELKQPRTDGWRVKVDELVWACVEGGPWHRIRPN